MQWSTGAPCSRPGGTCWGQAGRLRSQQPKSERAWRPVDGPGGLLHCTTVIAVASPHRFSPPLCDAPMIIHGQSAALGRVDRPLQNCSTAIRHAPDAQRKQAECMQVPKWSHPPPRAAVRNCMWLNNAALLGRSESSGRPQVLAPSMHNPSQPIANSAPPSGPPSHVPEIVLTCHVSICVTQISSSSALLERGSRRQTGVLSSAASRNPLAGSAFGVSPASRKTCDSLRTAHASLVSRILRLRPTEWPPSGPCLLEICYPYPLPSRAERG